MLDDVETSHLSAYAWIFLAYGMLLKFSFISMHCYGMYSWSFFCWHILWLKMWRKMVYLYSLYACLFAFICSYVYVCFPAPIFVCMYSLLLHLFCNYFRFCVDVVIDVMLQHLVVLNDDLRICSQYLYIVHVPCWYSLECWNMFEKTCVDVGTVAATSWCCSENLFFSVFLLYMFPIDVL
jgi:hypothetical protein